jgi:uncharacterized membrane protein
MPQQYEPYEPPIARSTNRNMLLPVLGAVLALASGLTYGMLDWTGAFDQMDTVTFALTLIVAIGVMAIVAGFLLGTWWSLLIVSVAFLGGMLLANSISVLEGGDWLSLLQQEVQLLPIYLAPAVTGAAIGTALVPWLTAGRRSPRAAA